MVPPGRSPPLRRRQWAGAQLAWALVLLVLFLGSFTTRLVPEPLYDRSIYQSVAERLLAGDRLYVDVIDNKDPLFYYAVAGQRLIGPLAEYGFELICVLGAALAAAGLARDLHPGNRAGPRAVFVLTAFLVSGLHYDQGGSIPPGIALTLLAIRLAWARRGLACGAALALLLFTKLIYAPIALNFLLVELWVDRAGGHGRVRFAVRCALAAGLGSGAILLALFVRGELSGYLAIQAENWIYSSTNVFSAHGLIGNIANHVSTALYFGKTILITSLVTFVFLVIDRLRSTHGQAAREYRACCLVIYPLSLVIVALTAIWGAHLAVLQVFLALAAADLVPRLVTGARAWLGYPAVAGIGLVLAGVGSGGQLLASPLGLAERLAALTAPSDEALALRRAAGATPVRYARLGSDNDFHHAAGTRADTLACPRFFQYRFTAPAILDGILACAARADFLIVDFLDDEPLAPGTFVSPAADFAALNQRWDGFVASAETMLKRRFRCTPAGATLRICRRIAARNP